MMRDSRAQDMAFEIVDMNLDERSKYRRMLAGSISNSPNIPATAESDVVSVPVRAAGAK